MTPRQWYYGHWQDYREILSTKMSYPSVMTTLIQNPRLRLLNALRAGSKPIMTFLGLPSFRTAQVVAQTGVDVSISPPQMNVPH